MSLKGIKWCAKRILDYSRLSRSPLDWPALAVLGLARAGFFSEGRALSAIFRRVFKNVNVRTARLSRLKVSMNPADSSQIDIFDEVVANNVYDLQLVPFEPKVCIDCGAHIGLFTLRVISYFKPYRMILFEPARENLVRLRKMIQLNRLIVDLRDEAVSDSDGNVVFYERNSCGGSTQPAMEGVIGSYSVKSINLLAFIAELSTDDLLLKMDVEGAEEWLMPKIIPKLPAKVAIFFETHSGETGWDLVSKALEDASFKVQMLTQRDPFRDGFALRI